MLRLVGHFLPFFWRYGGHTICCLWTKCKCFLSGINHFLSNDDQILSNASRFNAGLRRIPSQSRCGGVFDLEELQLKLGQAERVRKAFRSRREPVVCLGIGLPIVHTFFVWATKQSMGGCGCSTVRKVNGVFRETVPFRLARRGLESFISVS